MSTAICYDQRRPTPIERQNYTPEFTYMRWCAHIDVRESA